MRRSLLVTRWLASLAMVAIAAPNSQAQVNTSPLDSVKMVPAFENLKFTGWTPESAEGLPQPLRPIVLTHAGDGSNRVFVATQQGVVHVFPNKPEVDQTKVFLDIQEKVVYNDKQNEEGLLGMAFHPKYKETGEFFIYYTTTETPQMSVISRFRVSKDDPDKAEPRFEEEILRIKQPYWNHNGGTIAFGPDGFLYIALGDGGSGRDPHGNGQNLKTLLGSVLRIDIDKKDPGKAYAVPADNPFVGLEDAQPEIWAYGIRNIWRLSFDRETGICWAGEVGQDLWEEIDIIVKGGNYGWNLREGMHPFDPNGSGPRPELIEPIWEYHHNVGKSITGGNVYRGSKVPDLKGAYLYGDYVSGVLWALTYDFSKKAVTANRVIPSQKITVISYGEDEQGEVYLMEPSPTGKGIFRFEQK